jgi:hypothetical protein
MEPITECYGSMFPPVAKAPHNIDIAGKVLSYRIQHPGLMPTGHTLRIDRESWGHCLECKEFEGCYRLSIGRLLVDSLLPA